MIPCQIQSIIFLQFWANFFEVTLCVKFISAVLLHAWQNRSGPADLFCSTHKSIGHFIFLSVNHLYLAFCLVRRSPKSQLTCRLNQCCIHFTLLQRSIYTAWCCQHQHGSQSTWCVWVCNMESLVPAKWAFSPIAKNIQFGLIRQNNLFRVTLESPTWPCVMTSVEMFFVICFLKYFIF